MEQTVGPSEMIVHLGPQHPMMPGPFRLNAKLKGETVVDSEVEMGYIHKGIEKLPDSKKKETLHQWVNYDLKERFKNRIIDFDLKTATVWGKIQAHSELSGKSMPVIDGQIVATGISYDLTVVTRNTEDMEIIGALLLNPWNDDL